MPPQVSQEEFAWREWVLGESRFKEHGPRNPAARAQTGAPDRIPTEWWARLEEFLARRDESKEPIETPSVVRRVLVATHIPQPRADGNQLSPHFALAEFSCKDGTKVPKAAVPALTHLCEKVLEPLRDRFGACTVMSGYRHTAYNKKIGGAKFSQHIYDLHPGSVAADLTFASGRPSEWAQAAEPLCESGGLGRYPGFVHVDNRDGKARWSG
jgi:uncharacterized protein YcbK (DUF882 family)